MIVGLRTHWAPSILENLPAIALAVAIVDSARDPRWRFHSPAEPTFVFR